MFSSLNVFVQSISILILFLALGKFATWFAQNTLLRWTKKTDTNLDDLIVEKIKPPFSYVIWFLGIRLAIAPIGLEIEWVDKVLNTVILSIAFYSVAVVSDIIIKGLLGKITSKTSTTLDDTLMPLVNRTINIVIVILGIMWILAIWDIDLTPLVASLGVAGLALSFAMKDSLANIFGGISLILDQTISVGDKVKIESGDIGHIHEIGLRSTKLRTADNEMIIIPNGQLANSRIQNFAKPSLAQRVVVNFGVSYDSEVDKVRKVVRDAILSIDDIDEEQKPPEVLFIGMGESSLDFSARFWISNYANAWEKKLEATDKIFATLSSNKIDIPYPTRTIIRK